eukprot:g2737.t1
MQQTGVSVGSAGAARQHTTTSSLGGSTYLVYSFNLSVGDHAWTIHRRVREFHALHAELQKLGRAGGADAAAAAAAADMGADSEWNSRTIAATVSALPPLPERTLPWSAVARQEAERRRALLTAYLLHCCTQPALWRTIAVRTFCEVSAVSFEGRYGRKIVHSKEGWCGKAQGTGGGTVGTWRWRQRWFVCRDCFIAYFESPAAREPKGVILVSADLRIDPARKGVPATVIVLSAGDRSLAMRCPSLRHKQEWLDALRGLGAMAVPAEARAQHATQAAQAAQAGQAGQAGQAAPRPPHGSFVPVRRGCQAVCYVGGREYFAAVAAALHGAREEILIAGWQVNADLLLVRPPDGRVRLDQLLQRKAAQGVRVRLLLYREVSEGVQPNGSRDAKEYLSCLHPNIRVMRHPWHFNPLAKGALFFSHHEKLVVVDQQLAFVGGLDLAFGRWDDARHTLSAADRRRWPGPEHFTPRAEQHAPVPPPPPMLTPA